jgi:Recombination, repair and ssDNA binding protein UvsY
MKKLETILQEWSQDCIINEEKLKLELTNIPKLHAKYITYLNDHKLSSYKAKFDYDKMKEVRSSYYLGHLDQESLEEYNWEQFDIHVTKAGLDKYLNADEILIKLLQKKLYHDQAVYTCESILKELSARTWQMKSLIDYEKFLSGA